MFKQIRSTLVEDAGPLGGKNGHGVEMDEMYCDRKRKHGTGRPIRGDKKKTPVVGIVERKGRVKAIAADDLKGSTLLDMVHEYILPKTTVFTDELPSYDSHQSHHEWGTCIAESNTAPRSTWLATSTRTTWKDSGVSGVW